MVASNRRAGDNFFTGRKLYGTRDFLHVGGSLLPARSVFENGCTGLCNLWALHGIRYVIKSYVLAQHLFNGFATQQLQLSDHSIAWFNGDYPGLSSVVLREVTAKTFFKKMKCALR